MPSDSRVLDSAKSEKPAAQPANGSARPKKPSGNGTPSPKAKKPPLTPKPAKPAKSTAQPESADAASSLPAQPQPAKPTPAKKPAVPAAKKDKKPARPAAEQPAKKPVEKPVAEKPANPAKDKKVPAKPAAKKDGNNNEGAKKNGAVAKAKAVPADKDRPVKAKRADKAKDKKADAPENARPAKPKRDKAARAEAASAAAANRPLPARPKPGQSAAAQSPDDDAQQRADEAEAGLDRTSRFLLLNAMPSWLVSMIVHAIALLLLAILTLPEGEKIVRIFAISEPDEEIEEMVDELPEPVIDPVDLPVFTNEAALELVNMEPEDDLESVPEFDDIEAAPQEIKLDDFGEETAPKNDLLATVGAVAGTGLDGRGAEARARMAASNGASEGSEAAVAMALAWLAAHQQPDGGWSFDHTHTNSCRGQCPNPGRMAPSRMGATAMALLPFLGAGQTHLEGTYKENVFKGLYYLTSNMKKANGMGDMTDQGGRLYSHGLAAITLCEAYAMTNDRTLMNDAQMSLNFIVYAQDPVGGGWRYRPKQPGDTSVVGWQLMALKSGHMAYLRVPPNTILGATRFLDSVQFDSGAKYGYTSPADRAATTAVGLLCRMYLGWKHDEAALQDGVAYLSRLGPSLGGSSNMYYNYYATQVMRHYGGEPWEKWNTAMRDPLVAAQAKNGHMKGSWFMRGGHTERAGRLYCTSMATMMLEVYYRHMPIYGKQAAEDDFPL